MRSDCYDGAMRRCHVFLAAALALTACAEGGNGDAGTNRMDSATPMPDTGAPGEDGGGGVDSGPDDAGPMCGAVGDSCCPSGSCAAGARCDEGAGTCCADVGGAACEDQDDCCGDADCVGGACCSPQAGACRSSSDCCADLLCADGMCLRPFEECGREGEACCSGDACRSGLRCESGACAPCGALGMDCCPGSECAGENVCEGDTCVAPDPTCGGDGQPCCAGDVCDGALACTSGTCAAPASPCGYATCGECTANAGCGWCGSTGTCMEGGFTGPDSGSCADWDWSRAECADIDVCGDASACGDCTDRLECGWCASSNTCMEGGPGGPDTGSCGDWEYTNLDCAGGCEAQTDCETCTDFFSCGWCEGTGCTDGSSSGPDSGSCSNWSYDTPSCPMADPCNAHASCGTCNAASGCGWCESTGTCQTGTAGGPSTGSCGDWNFGAASCMCSMARGSCAADADCCGDLSCRVGVTFPVRCCVEAGGACPGGGPDCCGYMDCVAGTCQCRTSGACLEDGDCCSNNCSDGRCI